MEPFREGYKITRHDCARGAQEVTVRERGGGARGRDFYFILRARSFGATTTWSRSLFPFLARLLATFKSASRRGCSPSSFSVLRLSWRVPAYQASLRLLSSDIDPFPRSLPSFLLFSLSLFLFSTFFFVLNLPRGGRARVVALINF